MAWKNVKQRSFAESMLIDHDALKELDDVHELIDWHQLEQLLSDIHSSPRGEKAWPPLMMFKALLLQSWYSLSGSRVRKATGSRSSFQAVCWVRYFRVSPRSFHFLAL